jgi:hypothetical protein
VKIEKMEPFRLFSLSVGQSRLTMELEERVADDFLERFTKKTSEGGGIGEMQNDECGMMNLSAGINV